MKIAVIPARGGSKRIPRKNIKPFCGKPMIAWPIEAALRSNCFDHVIVSTDDSEIAAVARRHGAEVPFVRPADLSGDHAGTIPVIRHAAAWWAEHRAAPEHVCCIYATAPFVTGPDLARGLEILLSAESEFAFSVTRYAFPIQRAIRITAAGRVEMFNPDYYSVRSQDLEEAYHDAGQFYWGRAGAWAAREVLFGPHAAPVVIPRYRVQDIDTPEDWQMAEYLFQAVSLKEAAVQGSGGLP